MIHRTVLFVIFAVGALANEQLRELCRQNGAEDKVAEVAKSVHDFSECVGRIVDTRTATEEIQNAMLYGGLKRVLKMYCDKTPQLKTCVRTLYIGIAPCLASPVQNNIPAATKASEDAIDYICYDDGIRIFSFFTEGGAQCVQEKAVEIKECVTDIQNRATHDYSSWLRSFENGCTLLNDLQSCIVSTLSGCQTMIAANMAEVLLTYSRKANTCTV